MTALTLGPMFAYPLHVASWKRPAGNIEYRVTNAFDGPDFLNGGIHQATDVGNTRLGDTVKAPAACAAMGLRHTDGALGVRFDLGYGVTIDLWHLSKTILVGKWQPLARGQGCGATGNTGARLPDGSAMPAHTHIAAKRNGVPFDVERYLPMVERAAIPLQLTQEDDVVIPARARRTPNMVGTILGSKANGIRVRQAPIDGEIVVTLPARDFPFMSIAESPEKDGIWRLVFFHPAGDDASPVIGWVRSDFTSPLSPDQAADCSRQDNALERIADAAAGAKQAITAIEGLATG